jgi:hypothetical protein
MREEKLPHFVAGWDRDAPSFPQSDFPMPLHLCLNAGIEIQPKSRLINFSPRNAIHVFVAVTETEVRDAGL